MTSTRKKYHVNNKGVLRTSIGLNSETKRRMDENRAPGQSYDGFIRQLVDSWEKTQKSR